MVDKHMTESAALADDRDHGAAPFRRPDPGILNPSIPLFFVGQNRDGLWVARNADASSGGLFLLQSSAIRFTRSQRELPVPAIITRTRRFELDIPNSGNRFARQLAVAKRTLSHLVRTVRRAVQA